MDNKFSVSLTQIKPFDIEHSKDNINVNDCNMPIYKPLNFSKINYFYPTLEIFDNDNKLKSDNISLFTNRQIINYNTVYNNDTNSEEKVDIFFKFAPLLDPTRYMIGKYSSFSNNINFLPKLNDNSILEKYRSIHNASYTDNFACFLLGKLLHQHNFLHGIEYFGSFLSIQEKYRIDIVDEIEYLYESDYFKDNLNKLFFIDEDNKANAFSQFLNYGSRSNKPKLTIVNDDNNHDIVVDNIENDLVVEDINDINEIVYEKSDNPNEKISSDNDSDDDSEIEEDDDDDDKDDSSDGYEDCDSEIEEDDDDDEEDDEDDDEEQPVFAFINNFPVQTICIEKCHGTFDELLVEDNVDSNTARSILFQIIMILITLQKCFHLTHNDLHTNNVMFINTDIKYLYYKFNKKCYKVPTYGKIIKIIDYGRSIFKYNGHLFCSDSYSSGGDAHTQYNTEPFFNKDKPRLDPNYSFDLCRLGCSIYDFIIDDDMDYKDLDDFQKVISDWCSDDSKRNILYKKNGEERYPNFKLYKMIARTVHKHTPEEQLKRPYFSKYESKEFKNGFDIDAMPTYF